MPHDHAPTEESNRVPPSGPWLGRRVDADDTRPGPAVEGEGETDGPADGSGGVDA